MYLKPVKLLNNLQFLSLMIFISQIWLSIEMLTAKSSTYWWHQVIFYVINLPYIHIILTNIFYIYRNICQCLMIIKKIIFLILFKLQTAYHVKIQRIHWRMYKKLKKIWIRISNFRKKRGERMRILWKGWKNEENKLIKSNLLANTLS